MKTCFVKDTAKRVKKLAIDCIKMFLKHISNENLLSKIYKEPSKLSKKKNSIFKMGKRFMRILHQRK